MNRKTAQRIRHVTRQDVSHDALASSALLTILLAILSFTLAFLPGTSAHPAHAAQTRPAPAKEEATPLILRTPSDFVEIDKKNGSLFTENARQLGSNATLLRLFLPENQAHFYEEGKRYALTRQIAVYALKNPDNEAFTQEDTMWLGRVLDEGFLRFDRIPLATLRDSLALEDALLQAARSGHNLLLDSRTTENMRLFQYQLVYALMPGATSGIVDDRMLTSLTTIMLLVRGHIVFICASSINTQDPLYDDATWARDAAEKYMETLLADNKKN